MQFPEEFRQSWLSAYNERVQRNGTLHRTNEQPGVSALVLNLTNIDLKNVLDAAQVDDGKDHPGVRVTFAILRILSPGFASFQADGHESGKRKAGGKGSGASSAPKERYGRMQGDGMVVMHSYELLNKKGAFSKGWPSEKCIVLAPGMIISNRVFGNKLHAVFGKDHSQVNAFQLAMVQLGTSSMSASGAESGNLLQIRSYAPLPPYSASSLRLVPLGIMSSSVQAAMQRKESFMSGCMVSEDQKENLDMSLIRGSLNSSVSVIDVGYIDSKNGAFSVSATGSIRFHVTEPIADITARVIEVKIDERDFGTNDIVWISKLLNVAVLLQSVRMLVSFDGYRNKDLEAEVSYSYPSIPPLFCSNHCPSPFCSNHFSVYDCIH